MKQVVKFNPILKAGIIRGIGVDNYYKSHPLTRKYLFQEGLKEFFMWQERNFGSRHNYNIHIIKRNGWVSVKEYLNEWAKTHGLKDYSEYNKKYHHKRVLELKSKGLCYDCKNNINNLKHSRCDSCLTKHKEKARKRATLNLNNTKVEE